MKCYICQKELYSELGNGCLLCGMPIKKTKEFCCGSCKNKFEKINKGAIFIERR